jgi:RNA polymerase sigma-70 factor (sigma-E family)
VTGWSDEQFSAYVEARLPALVAFGYRLTGDLGHSQDLVQTALIAVYARSRRQAPNSPEAYVRRAILNAFLSSKRRRRVTESLMDAVPDTAESVHATPSEQRQDLLDRLVGLTPRQRAVLVLRYHDDWTEEQIAEAIGVSVGGVKKLATRALAQLRVQTADGKEWSR